MRITVVIPTWRRPGSIVRCLRAVERQERLPDEVLVVVRPDDEATTAALSELESTLPVELVPSPEPGVVAAVNTGLDHASGDVIVLTDDDTCARPGWLATIERHFRDDPRLGGLGGRDWLAGECGTARRVGTISWFGRVVGNHHLGTGAAREVDMLKGANMAYRAAAIDDFRMDAALRGSGVQHHSDMDLSMAVKAAGWRLLYDPAAALDHFEEKRHGSEREDVMTSRDRRDAAHNQMLAFLKHLRGTRRVAAVLYALAVGTRNAPGPALAVERVLREPDRNAVLARALASTRGRLDAFQTLRRSERTRPGTRTRHR